MSGGSWEYAYCKFEEVASRLKGDSDPMRCALGERVALIAAAMHDIEWVDSGDYGKGAEKTAILAALGENAKADVLATTLKDAERIMNQLRNAIKRAGEK